MKKKVFDPLILAMISLLALSSGLVACGGNNNNASPSTPTPTPEPMSQEPVAAISQVAMGMYTFREFNNISGEAEEITVSIPGATFYGGELSGRDGFVVPIYVVLDPGASINRVLVLVNGGTGTDVRFFLEDFDHRAVVYLSMRGLAQRHLQQECALGTGLIECLKGLDFLAQVNPLDNGRDLVDLMRIIVGDAGKLMVDGAERDSSFFQVDDQTINIETGSFGATILGYALAEAELPSIGRIFIDGPSSPSEHVITDGFRNAKVAFENLADTFLFTTQENIDAFIRVLQARHSAPNTNCPPTSDFATPLPSDCLSSSMIWKYMFDEFETISEARGENREQFTFAQVSVYSKEVAEELLSIPATAVPTGNENFVVIEKIYRQTVGRSGVGLTWEDSRFDLLSANGQLNGLTSHGFTSRIGMICSAYITRMDGDSQARFDGAMADQSNDPYWYGFLISFRDLLTICPEISGNVRTGIMVPGESLAVNAEALVQYGAGIDEKHHRVDIAEMRSYFSDQTYEREFYREVAFQGGIEILNAECFDEIRSISFEESMSNLNNAFDQLVTDCLED